MRNLSRVRKGSAFTLIELLIVVAIIAILAAIAVPNFLEAQTRAKIARVKADQRTLATAVESYAVDFNRVPIGLTEVASKPWVKTNWGNLGDELLRFRIYAQLTTPMSYMSNIPIDVFTQGTGQVAQGPAFGRTGVMEFNSVWSDMATYPAPKNWGPANWRAMLTKGYTWYVFAMGPSRFRGYMPPAGLSEIPSYWVSTFYDATNGTTSRGLIVRSNKRAH